MNGTDVAISRIFEAGINDRLPPGQLLVLGLQNVFGMTGMFVFPGLLAPSNLGDGKGRF
jgi:xanthine/uracil permease